MSLAALPGFSEADATTLHSAVTTDNFTTLAGFFNSPTDARRVTSLASKLKQNKFDVTHYNHDPQTTFFNEPRIVLTTQEKYAPRDAAGNILKDANGVPYLLDILKTPNTDPGQIYTVNPNGTTTDVIDADKLDAVIKKLRTYLQRTDWPMVPATATSKSFQAKYFGGDSSRLGQLALGIIDYVRCAESTRVIIEPVRVVVKNGDYKRVTGSAYGGDPDTFIGSPRRVYIREMGVWRAQDLVSDPSSPVKGKLKIKLYINLYLAPNGGIDQVDLLEPEPGKKFFMWTHTDISNYPAPWLVSLYNSDGQDAFAANDPTGLGINRSMPVTAINIIGDKVLKAGENRTLVFDYYYSDARIQTTGALPQPFIFYPRYAMRIAKDQVEANAVSSLEIAPLGVPPRFDNQGYPVSYGVQFSDDPSKNTMNVGGVEPPNTTNPSLVTYVTDDPRVNATPNDWKFYSPSHTVGGALPNSMTTLGSGAVSVGGGNPPRDSNSSNKVTDASFRVPYPKGHAKNPHGMVTSPAELGFIHTGLEGLMSSKGTSWRSLRLQATKGAITSVPDWALMDLFAVPADVSPAAAALLSPHGTGAGRVNINVGRTGVAPFGIVRSSPLKAVLLNARTLTSNTSTRLSDTQANTVVANIRALKLAGGASAQKYGYADAFNSPGEIVEIEGIADSGEDSEEMVRSISNLINTRSNVFGVYTVGQALKQVNGTLQVTGEQRQHAILERYLDSGKLVRFRTVYFRNLNP